MAITTADVITSVNNNNKKHVCSDFLDIKSTKFFSTDRPQKRIKNVEKSLKKILL